MREIGKGISWLHLLAEAFKGVYGVGLPLS